MPTNKDNYVTQEQYEKSLTSEDYVKFSQTFNADETQRLIQHSIHNLILQDLTCDHKSREAIKNIIRDIAKEEFWSSLKKFGWIMYGIISIFGGTALTLIVQYFVK